MGWRAPVAAATLFAAVGIAQMRPVAADPLPTPTADPHRDLDHEGCLQCHAVQASEWLGSSHQTSFVESTFQVAHALEPKPFCRRCHAPLADPKTVPTGVVAELGVACSSCHVQDGQLVQKVDCVSCHEFPFPDNVFRDEPLMMQTTGLEHAGSRFATTSCVECHMAEAADGHRVHSFVASRDPELVRSAVHVDAERVDGETIRVTLRPGRVGHAFPTGDLLRRVEVAARVDGGEPARRYLARHFGGRVQRNGAWMRSLLADDRVPEDGERIVELRVRDGNGAPIHWWVQYQRVAHHTSFEPTEAALDGVVDVASGVLPPTNR